MKLTNIPTIRELLDRAPEKHADRTFIKFIRDGRIAEKKFSEVRSDSLAFCRKLRHLLGEKKTHIAIISKSCYEYIVGMTGILISGSVAVPVAPDASAGEVAEILNDADVTAVLYEPEFTPRLEEVKALCPGIEFTLDLGSAADFERIYRDYGETSPYAALSDVRTDPAACALIIYTSGTTGDKKGVMLSGEALVGNMMFKPYSDIVNRRDVILSVLPLYHIFCFVTDYLGPLKNGNELCLNGDMRELFKNLLIFRPNQMRVVPMLASALLGRIRAVQAKHPELSPKEAAALVTGGNLDMMLSGGAYLDPALCMAFDQLGIFLRQGYGMSEAGCKITVPDFDTAVDCVGRVMNIVDVRIRGGEVQVNTPCRMIGYYKRPKETAAAFTEDGWLKTGDIGYLGEGRQLYITGRLKNLIILSNGENVSPEGIEKRYQAYGLVKEALVYADGDRIAAEIYPDADYAAREGITDVKAALEEITDRLNATAQPSHTVAKLTVRTEPLEKTATGKLLRRRGGEKRGIAG
ncbi:MAG: AMP-binding protein [Clostridia bacterium]|nr:AMP-binding protein [Clostridia bacterium]